MRLIGSESEEQHGEVSTIVDVSPEGKPPAERRLMTRADAERLLAEHGHPEPVSPADRAAIRSMLDIGDPEPLSPAAVDHLLGWYTAADKVAEVQRRLALGEVQGMFKPIGLGLDISAIVDPMAEMREQVLRSFSDMRQQVAAFLGVSSTENFRQMLAFAAQDQMVQALAENLNPGVSSCWKNPRWHVLPLLPPNAVPHLGLIPTAWPRACRNLAQRILRLWSSRCHGPPRRSPKPSRSCRLARFALGF